MNPKNNRAYVLLEIQPGKEKEFSEEILSKGLILDSKVERMDFVHGSFDFIIHLELSSIRRSYGFYRIGNFQQLFSHRLDDCGFASR